MDKGASTVVGAALLLRSSTLPYGLPPLDRITTPCFRPALELGLAEHAAEVASVVEDRSAPTFENTVVALERAGQPLAQCRAVFNSLLASNTNDELDALDTEMAPKFAAHTDSIFLNKALYNRVRDASPPPEDDIESQRLRERYLTMFERRGAALSEPAINEMRHINEHLSKLAAQFRQAVLKATNDCAVVVDDVALLDGLSPGDIASAAAAASQRGLPAGRYALTLVNTTTQPALASLKNREVRRKLFEASRARCSDGACDTRPIIVEMAQLRARMAQLLSYPNYASYVIADETASSVNDVNAMLRRLIGPAHANAERERADLERCAGDELGGDRLQPWDWAFYANRLQKQLFDFSDDDVRPYFEVNRVLKDGVLFAANRFYGITFKQRNDLPTYHKDVMVFELFNEDGSPLGMLLADYFARSNKQGGGWMDSYIEQSKLLGHPHAIVLNNLNVPVPAEGEPALMIFDEVTTAFHEMGHALHGLFSNVKYPLFSGTSVPRDYVEYPSQLNEMWATDPAVLSNYARHHKTGDPMPQALLSKVISARRFNQGFATTEYLAAAILDQAWHQISPTNVPDSANVAEFERNALQAAGISDFFVPRYRSPYFSHIWSSATGYAAGYYAYIWSEVLARDTQSWIGEQGGLRRTNGDVLRGKVLSKGFACDPLSAFKDLKGGPPDIAPLLDYRGLRDASVAV
ncbi:hypothetical protein PBRA_001300 [Plasmodiophora brassicae]|uniref:oligopeptidase A n=1 Tax=Plasmodiophora brassicae TaxID=37360 RepID=A0A0G4IW84_PLABS|nr:hypothetical protein PBRA_001300 [Plasmodiophora brassicae]